MGSCTCWDGAGCRERHEDSFHQNRLNMMMCMNPSVYTIRRYIHTENRCCFICAPDHNVVRFQIVVENSKLVHFKHNFTAIKHTQLSYSTRQNMYDYNTYTFPKSFKLLGFHEPAIFSQMKNGLSFNTP